MILKEMSESDRPREKMMQHGVAALSESELLAILIGSGTRDVTAVELCQQIMRDNENNLNLLGKKSVKHLIGYKGIGEAKAITIVAALELGRRRKALDGSGLKRISCSADIFYHFYPLLNDLHHEEFWVMLLNNSLRVIHKEKIGQGGINETTADIRLIFHTALSHRATGLVLCHNHPSGNLEPSSHDLKLTQKVVQASLLFNIKVIDHLIISDGRCYSFHEEGKI